MQEIEVLVRVLLQKKSGMRWFLRIVWMTRDAGEQGHFPAALSKKRVLVLLKTALTNF